MLRKDDSNKVLKGVKAIIFATSLSLLNPVGVEAAENLQQVQDKIVSDEEKNVFEVTNIVIGGVSLIIFVSAFSSAIIKNIHVRKSLNNHTNIYLGKLSDKKSKDDINDAVKYLKLTNGLESNDRC